MNSRVLKPNLLKTGIAACVLFLANGMAMAQSAVTLTAAPTSTTLPDGQSVPMWGYTCGTVSGIGASCLAANGAAQTLAGGWQPPLITVPSGQPLTITLINNLNFGAEAGQKIPTSLVIVGQLGGGLGATPARMPSPVHGPQGTTWPGTPGAPGACGTEGTFCPPTQADRVRSFATEVAATGVGSALTWNNLRPGTYLIHSGTQPSIQHPMGLYGTLVVTDPAYPGQTFDKDVALLLSEIDAAQNIAVDTAVRTAGFSDASVWSAQAGSCGDPAIHNCYPPAVNYDPRYYLINGKSFDRSSSTSSVPAVLPGATTGRVMLRFVNAGLRMHVPSVVGANLTLLAEDGNKLPGVPKVQSSLFLAAGKTYDVTMQPRQTTPGTYDAATYPVFDRALGLSTNNQRDGGMQAYINVAGGTAPAAVAATAVADSYFVVTGNTLTVDDPARGLIANDKGIYGVKVSGAAPVGLTLNPNGTFSYTGGPTSFTYCGNGATSGAACATVTLAACGAGCLGGAPTAVLDSYTSNVASRLQISPPGVLANDTDPTGLPLKASALSSVLGGTVTLNPDGSFTATPTTPPLGAATAVVSFQYRAVNSQNTLSAPVTATVTFNGRSNLAVAVKDGKTGVAITDYRWIIEEDRTAYINPAVESAPGVPVRNLAINFHTSHMPVVAQGCVGPISCETGQTVLDPLTSSHVPAVCDVGNGKCRTGVAAKTQVSPSDVRLDPLKRYYISVLPGDGANPVVDGSDGHTMSGAQISSAQVAAAILGTTPPTIDVYVQKTALEPAKIAVFVFQDDSPLNGENDSGGGIDILAPNEPGLAGFNIVLLDQAGTMGDSTGQITYDMFGMPVSNSLAGTIDPRTGLDACPISKTSTDGLVGMIVTCPKYESDGATLSPLAGHALIANMYPGLYEVLASPGADRMARGEEWLQTNTLDGTKAIEVFIKAGEPGYFQEFGPGGFHVAMGFANPKIINDRKAAICAPPAICTATINGMVTATRMSRTPDQRVYSSGSYDAYSFTQCYVSLGTPDGPDFAFEKCNPDGTFTFTGIPRGNMKVTVFDQWNDLLVDGLSTPINVNGAVIGTIANPLQIPVTQWRTNLYGRVFLDQNGDGVSQDTEPGLPLVPFNIRYRDGSYAGFNNTDLAGFAGFNEVFPFLNWLVVDIDNARHKLTGVHVVHDAGGPVDGTPGGGLSTIGNNIANTIESPTAHLPLDLRVPGSRYCADADCTGTGSFNPASGNAGSTGRVDPPWASTQGWQGLLGQNSFIEFAMKPFAAGENGGIKGHVLYTPTRPFDDPALLLQLSWAPGVANVQVNLYRQDTAADGTKSLKLVDKTTSSSWDDFAQGFRSDGKPNMNCPGQETASPFYFTMQGGTMPLNPTTALPYEGRFKCYDGWSMLNQVQPAPYNGMYKFPSVTARDPLTGKPTATNCTGCVTNTFVPATDFDNLAPMLPPGKYVVEVIVPQGYELVKEEDKNILLGDAFVAPAVQQFAGFGNIFIMPDQAAVNAFYNPTNTLQRTTNNGAVPRREGDTGSVEVFWPCVGEKRIVPDLISLFPAAGQQAPFAGATRPLCDRKEITLNDEMTALAKFYIFSSTHVAGHFTGQVTNDFASEFDPFSPQFGEKFAVPNAPVAMRDFSGKEISRVYTDQWGAYNGLNFSTYTVNPPSPSGYVPQMMTACMNDPGPIPGPNGTMITDPMYNPAYSNFCYEIPFMPGQTAYLDTPVVPTMAFAAGYNLPDCEYPDATPAIKSVLGSAIGVATNRGPWVSAAGQPLTINALGDKQVLNHAYSGPMATATPFNKKFITRHYGFGPRPSTCPATGACPNVTIGGVSMTNVATWTDLQIVGNAPSLTLAQSSCPIAQRTPTLSIGASARCGQLEITAANGKKSIDTVTVTIAGKAPTYVTPDSPSVSTFGHIQPNPLQTAIDQAAPGDLIIVGPGTYKENLLMWKPVRLQGVAAEAVTINADAHPAGKMDAWRRQLNCLFGLALNGQPNTAANPYDANSVYSCPVAMQQHVDRIDFESILGWDTTGNGNLAQMLQEPTLMGAYEGAGVTVLGKGVVMPANTPVPDQFGAAAAGGFPAGFRYLNASTGATGSDSDCLPAGSTGSSSALTSPTDPASAWRDHYTTNFLCNPSRIDGVSVINSSQGGGAIFAHAWNHFLEVANTRVHGNHGTLTGGITIGNGEFPDAIINDGVLPLPFAAPPNTTNMQLGYGFNRNVNVHHNAVTSNASIGDALYSATASGAGGVTFCSGADGYKLNNNWICGNLSTGDAGGVSHSGFINDGTISHNQILFNQSQSATIQTNGGGLAVLGASPDRTITTGPNAGLECGSLTDADCPPGLPEGTGRNLLIDANLILGNSAESGTGGGLRLQMVNGDDVVRQPANPATWNSVRVTNNIIVNNVAGWDGGGVSMQDALVVRFVNNTVMANDTTASAGVLFNTLGAPFAATPPPGCTPDTSPSATCPATIITSTNQAAGLVTMRNTPNMVTALTGLTLTCPAGFGYNATNPCSAISLPQLTNNVLWQNRAFHVEVGGAGPGQQVQQNVVTLVPTLNQTSTGQIVTTGTNVGAPGSGGPVNYWDIGVRGDTSPTVRSSGYTLVPNNSILSSGGYAGTNLTGDPLVVRQYSNGARIPPEGCLGVDVFAQPRCKGYNAPAGRSEFTGLPVLFALNQLVVAATVDEGNNWINLNYGPLSSVNPVDGQTVLGNYAIRVGSPAINAASAAVAPSTDFFGRSRGANPDIGAVEFVPGPSLSVSGGPLLFGNVPVGTTSAIQTLTLTNTGSVALSGVPSFSITQFSAPTPPNPAGGTCYTIGTLGSGASCTVNVRFQPTAAIAYTGTFSVTGLPAGTVVFNSPVTLTGTGVALAPIVTVTGGPLAFGNVAVGATSSAQLLTLTNSGTAAFTFNPLTFSSAVFSRPAGVSGGTCGATLAVATSCTIGVVLSPAALGPANGTLTIAGNAVVSGSPVALSGTGTAPTVPIVTVAGGPLAFGPVAVGVTSSALTLTLTNSGTATFTFNPLTFSSAVFSRSGGTCGASLAVATSCTIGVVLRPIAVGAANGTLTIAGNAVVSGSPVTLNGTGAAPTLPVLTVLDNFNRANAVNLGANWSQAVNSITLNANQAFCTGILCAVSGSAFWNVPATGFGAKQAAAFTIANTTLNGDALYLKVTGGTATLPTTGVRVRVTGTTIVMETTTNGGITYTPVAGGTFTATTVNGNTVSAMIDASGLAYVWVGSTFIGAAQTTFTGTGRIGIRLPNGARVDNFAGGTVP